MFGQFFACLDKFGQVCTSLGPVWTSLNQFWITLNKSGPSRDESGWVSRGLGKSGPVLTSSYKVTMVILLLSLVALWSAKRGLHVHWVNAVSNVAQHRWRLLRHNINRKIKSRHLPALYSSVFMITKKGRGKGQRGGGVRTRKKRRDRPAGFFAGKNM